MMEILINNEKLDFKLEKEKNVGDIIKGLENCVLENGNVIESISLDNRIIPYDYSSFEFRENISEVNELKIITSNQIELAVNTMVTVGEYINKLLDEYIRIDSLKYYDAILEGLKLIYEGTLDSLRILKIKSMVVVEKEGRTFADILLEMGNLILKYEKKYIDADGIKILKPLLESLLYTIPKVFKWAVVKNYSMFSTLEKTRIISYLKMIFADLYIICSSSVNKFEDIGRNLQLGEDRNALNDLFYLTELLDEVISVLRITKLLLPMLSSDDNCDGLFQEMTNQLKDIERAFKDGDMITVGDILEYEVRPLFEKLLDLLKKLKI